VRCADKSSANKLITDMSVAAADTSALLKRDAPSWTRKSAAHDKVYPQSTNHWQIK
jgi:hypothetical protein